jgi:MSHA biogenesis protein MshK
MSRWPIGTMCAMFALFDPAAAVAQAGLVDPTRPPNVVDAGLPSEATPAGMQLQSVLIAPGRRIAVIDGQTVALGGRLGEAKIVRIDEASVTLLVGQEKQVLQLLPESAKKTVRRQARRTER